MPEEERNGEESNLEEEELLGEERFKDESLEAITKSLSKLQFFIANELEVLKESNDINYLLHLREVFINTLGKIGYAETSLIMIEAAFRKCMEQAERGDFNTGDFEDRLKRTKEVSQAALEAGSEIDPKIKEIYEQTKKEMAEAEGHIIKSLVDDGKIILQ